MASLFGFAQFDFAGTLALGDGRYLFRDARAEGAESVLVIETVGAPRQPSRRRRRPRGVDSGAPPQDLPLARATAIRAYAPFADADHAERWLDAAAEDEESADELVAEGIWLLNRALHAQAVAAGEAGAGAVTPAGAVAVRIGWGSGEETASGGWSSARELDFSGGGSRRRRREADLRPQERVAAVLGGRERLDACETLLLRARDDLDAGRDREATLQLRVGVEALLRELRGGVDSHDHDRDMAELEQRRKEVGEAADEALVGDPPPEHTAAVSETLALAERILRRRRVLRG